VGRIVPAFSSGHGWIGLRGCGWWRGGCVLRGPVWEEADGTSKSASASGVGEGIWEAWRPVLLGCRGMFGLLFGLWCLLRRGRMDRAPVDVLFCVASFRSSCRGGPAVSPLLNSPVPQQCDRVGPAILSACYMVGPSGGLLAWRCWRLGCGPLRAVSCRGVGGWRCWPGAEKAGAVGGIEDRRSLSSFRRWLAIFWGCSPWRGGWACDGGQLS